MAAQCGPRELVLRLLRMSYSLCLKQKADENDTSKRVPDTAMQNLGRDFLNQVDAIEG